MFNVVCCCCNEWPPASLEGQTTDLNEPGLHFLYDVCSRVFLLFAFLDAFLLNLGGLIARPISCSFSIQGSPDPKSAGKLVPKKQKNCFLGV